MKIYKITKKEIPWQIAPIITGLWVVEVDDGSRYFGYHTKKQAEDSMDPQPIIRAYKG